MASPCLSKILIANLPKNFQVRPNKASSFPRCFQSSSYESISTVAKKLVSYSRTFQARLYKVGHKQGCKMNAPVFYWIIRALQVSAIPLLLLAWLWCFRLPAGRSRALRIILLMIATASHIWLLLPTTFLGPSYSRIRFSIIDANALVMLICSIAAFVSKGKGKVPLGIAAILTTWLWAITGTINTAL